MCGIWMKTRFAKGIEPSEVLKPASLLEHRGPDGWAYFADAKVILLQTRLSIVDLEGGTQPLESFDGRYIGIVNGELYDFETHRAELEKSGVEFKTKSDSEVLLNLFAKFGIKGLNRLSGEFAFVFYDRKESRVVFGRDYMGVKPLFIRSTIDSFSLASEMKALVPEGFKFNLTYLKTYLAHSITPPDTAIEGIEHVWPGQLHSLDLNTRKLTRETFQVLPLGNPRKLQGEEAIEKVDFELRAAVKRRLRADVEVGSYLSGGIDSALVAAIAADQGAKLKTFTVGFADADYDESKQAAQIAKDLGLSHSVVEMTAKNFMPSLKKSIVAFENPIANPHGAAKNLLSAKAAAELKVVLSGEGADEWFGGYAYLRIEKIKRFQERHPHLGAQALTQFLSRESEQNLNHLDGHATHYSELAKRYFKGLIPSFVGRLPEGLSNSQVSLILEKMSTQMHSELGDQALSLWDLNTWIAVRADLMHYILANVGDRQEMSNSLEGRTPFLDIRMTELASQIRENDLMKGLREKYVLRKLAARYLKPEHVVRRKKPFFAPSTYLFTRTNRAEVEHYIEIGETATPELDWAVYRKTMRRNDLPRTLNGEDDLLFFTLFAFSLGVLKAELIQIRKPLNTSVLIDHRRNF